ncbi:MAG: MptD family putative ECF transporter S component [Eubacteriaceae bacterium]|jgi:energy-coupling factor transport system substrate-specific component|nr:MptD family putative ECF transporter S component [Eubacteriaceae bacterium]
MNRTSKTKSLIQIGIFAVIYTVVLVINVVLTHFNPVTFVFLPVTLAISEGPVFALYMTRIQSKGMILALAIVVSFVLVAIGHIWTVLVIAAICGLLAEWIIGAGDYKDFKKITIGYAIFQLWVMGIFTPIWLARDTYMAGLDKQMGENFSTTLAKLTPNWMFVGLMVLIVIGAIVGINLGKKACNQKFKNAGII